MTWRFFSADRAEAMDRLNNAVQCGPLPSSGIALGGKTLIFTAPSATVTFPGAADANVSLKQVVASIAAVTGMHVGTRPVGAPGGQAGQWFYVAMWRDGGFTISKDGTANALLGVSTSADRVGKAPLSISAVKSISRNGNNDRYECVVGGLDADFDSPNADGSASTPGAGGGGGGNVVVP